MGVQARKKQNKTRQKQNRGVFYTHPHLHVYAAKQDTPAHDSFSAAYACTMYMRVNMKLIYTGNLHAHLPSRHWEGFLDPRPRADHLHLYLYLYTPATAGARVLEKR